MKKNIFKYSAANLNNLNSNPQHKFPMNYSMMLYRANALYSFIPKNACSTMRLSVAIENGCIKGIEQGHWIHNNNQSFNASLGEAVKADYTFTILRCPYRRLVSVFLDKFVAKEPDAWQYRGHLQRKIELDDFTFREFVLSLTQPGNLRTNIHWRPQVDFLLYENYDDYFSLESFPLVVETLKQKIEFEVHDARTLTNHGTERFEKLKHQNFADTAAFDIALMKRNGQIPDYGTMYDGELYDAVSKLYAADIALYKQKIGAEHLLAKPQIEETITE